MKTFAHIFNCFAVGIIAVIIACLFLAPWPIAFASSAVFIKMVANAGLYGFAALISSLIGGAL